jgi:hypothetical protein
MSARSHHGRQSLILEIAQIDVKPGMESAFEASVKQAAPLFKRTYGKIGQIKSVRDSAADDAKDRFFGHGNYAVA